MNKAKIRQMVLQQMKEIYYKGVIARYDWMGYLITEDNKPSYHHIVKREDLLKQGESIEATVENGAYLGKKSHEMLHQIEQLDPELYECWNDLFLMINKMRIYPIQDVWEMIYQLRWLSEQVINEANRGKYTK